MSIETYEQLIGRYELYSLLEDGLSDQALFYSSFYLFL